MADSCPGRSVSSTSRLLHGWISIILMALIVGIGTLGIFRVNRLMAGAYLVSVASGMTGVLYAFCAKCSCRDTCRHIFLGPLTRYLPRREMTPYTSADLAMTATGLSPMVLFPQYWLFTQKPLLLLFWQLTAALLVEILLFICKGCDNQYCPAKKIRK